MKTVPWFIWLIFIAVAGTGWGLWFHDKMAKPDLEEASLAVQAPHVSAPTSPSTLYSPSQSQVAGALPNQYTWQEYAATRQKVLQDNPELAAEFQKLQADIKAEQQKLYAAMIEADAKAGPILAKLEASRQRMTNASSHLPPAPTPSK